MQLKSRVWDKLTQKFLSKNGYYLAADGSVWIDCAGRVHEGDKSRYIVSYSICLTDKNKDDLYGGDIVKWIAKPLLDDEFSEYIGVIEWNDVLLGWEVVAYLRNGKPCKFEIRPDKVTDDEKFERLGNKFQKPEILEASA